MRIRKISLHSLHQGLHTAAGTVGFTTYRYHALLEYHYHEALPSLKAPGCSYSLCWLADPDKPD